MWSDVSAFVAEHRAARLNRKTGKLREAIDQRFSNAVGQIFDVGVATLVDEGQHGNRVDGGYGVAVASAPVKTKPDDSGDEHQGHNDRREFVLPDSGDDVLGARSSARLRRARTSAAVHLRALCARRRAAARAPLRRGNGAFDLGVHVQLPS